MEGSLMYLMTRTRPDICYTVSCLGQFSMNPTQEHFTQLKWVLRYVKGTNNYGIYYPKDDNTELDAWTDAT